MSKHVRVVIEPVGATDTGLKEYASIEANLPDDLGEFFHKVQELVKDFEVDE